MFKLIALSIVGCVALAIQAPAQITNEYPLTALEIVEATTGQLVVKSTALVGTVSASSTALSVTCAQDTIISTGHKQFGVVLGIRLSGNSQDKTAIDYDELDSLLHSVDYLSKIDWSVTSLASFDAGYTTRAGFRVAAFSSKRAGKIQFVVRSARFTKGIFLTPDELYQFYTLLAQAKTNLDTLRNPTPSP